MFDLKLVGVTNECVNRVPIVKRVLDHLTPGRTRCTEYEDIHSFYPIVGCADECTDSPLHGLSVGHSELLGLITEPVDRSNRSEQSSHDREENELPGCCAREYYASGYSLDTSPVPWLG